MSSFVGMINREDFEASLKAERRQPTGALVSYRGNDRDILYLPVNFDKIKFPAQKIVLQFVQGSGQSFRVDDKDKTKDLKKVRPLAKKKTKLGRILEEEGLKKR